MKFPTSGYDTSKMDVNPSRAFTSFMKSNKDELKKLTRPGKSSESEEEEEPRHNTRSEEKKVARSRSRGRKEDSGTREIAPVEEEDHIMCEEEKPQVPEVI